MRQAEEGNFQAPRMPRNQKINPKSRSPRDTQQFFHRLFLGGLLGSLGDLSSARLVRLDDGLDDTNGNGLPHVTDSEATKWWVVSESLNAHRLGGNHLDDGSVTRLDELGAGFDGLARTTIDLLEELGEFAGDVGGVAIEDRRVTSTDLAGVVEDDDLGVEGVGTLGRVVLGVTSNVTTTDFLDGNVLDVEADVVTGETLGELLVVHFNGLDFGGDTSWGEGDNHTGLDGTGLNTTNRDRANTTNLVHILKRQTKRLVRRTGRRVDSIDSLKKGLAGRLGLGLLLPTLVPGAVGGGFDHVVTVEARDGDERNGLGVVADLLDEVGGLLDDLVVAVLGPLGGVHLVDGNNDLPDTKGVGKESVLTGLAILGDTGLELTSTSGNDENGAISLGGTSDHVLDEITVTGGV